MKKFSKLFFTTCLFLGVLAIPYVQPQICFAQYGNEDQSIIFFKFLDVEGPVAEPGYEGWSKAIALSFGILRPDLTTTTEECQGLQIVKYIGYDSPAIAERFMTYPTALFGTGEVKIAVVTVIGRKVSPVYEITLGPTAMQSFGSGGAYTDDPLHETLTLFPNNLQWKTYEYNDRGDVISVKTYELSCVPPAGP